MTARDGKLIGRFYKKKWSTHAKEWAAPGDQYEIEIESGQVYREAVLVLPVIFHVLFFGENQVPGA
ncbi:hypothetical protein [Halobacillus sp. A5]|uniref:hypothetical protein n=1 Tax=Halobacillus sp. A5 TaxID=2880263 RepID=UPI0020A63B22|nr:hypothetical protein [Halobacillus sp. A5]MCP3027169.1 hypothetical protein [Halobacillus sp. A5]